MTTATKVRCKYRGCNRIMRTADGYCNVCVEPSNRPRCKACNAERGWAATYCQSCANTGNSRQAHGTLCKPITREGMEELRKGWKPWHTIIDDDVKEMRIMQAQDLVTVGLLTEDQSRDLYPVAWQVIDKRKASNMMEAE